jgi:hypothetical protein
MPAATVVRLRMSGALIGLIALFCSAPAKGQQVEPATLRDVQPVVEGELSLYQIHKLPGRLLSQGRNNKPIGPLGLLTYRLEEIQLPTPVRTKIKGEMLELSTAWRLTVTGGPFTVRDAPAVISVDGVPIGIGAESADLRRLTVVTFNRAALRDGGTISVGYGIGDPEAVELPDKLTMKTAR